MPHGSSSCDSLFHRLLPCEEGLRKADIRTGLSQSSEGQEKGNKRDKKTFHRTYSFNFFSRRRQQLQANFQHPSIKIHYTDVRQKIKLLDNGSKKLFPFQVLDL